MVRMERYFPRADEFLPERWLPEGESLKALHPFAHMPFGFGPRTCVGRRFAQLEMETFLSKVSFLSRAQVGNMLFGVHLPCGFGVSDLE